MIAPRSLGTFMLAAATGLAACAPLPVERAERLCLEQARLAKAPRGTVAVGAGTQGLSSKIDVTISSDFLLQRDPSAVFDACVFDKSGQPPRQPLYSRLDWKG